MKYSIRELYIEVTRRCNLRCPHCMRGDAQNIDLSKEDVDLLFEKLNGGTIEHLHFGGGEPTLNPDIIVYTIDKIIKENISVANVAMITNGQIFSKEIAEAFNRFDDYLKRSVRLTKSYISGRVIIAFSVDKYHDKICDRVREAYGRCCKWLRISDYRISDKRIIKTGRAKFGKDYTYRLIPPRYMIEYSHDDETEIFIKGNIYLTASGLITNLFDGSFKDMDKINYGHISDFSFYDYLDKYGEPIKEEFLISNFVTKQKIKKIG